MDTNSKVVYDQYQKVVGMHSGMEFFQYVGYESLPKIRIIIYDMGCNKAVTFLSNPVIYFVFWSLAFITEMSLWDTVFTHKTSLTPPGCETNWQSLVTYKVSAAHISIEQLILVSLTFSLLIQIIINITEKFVLHIDNKRLISNGQHYNQTHR